MSPADEFGRDERSRRSGSIDWCLRFYLPSEMPGDAGGPTTLPADRILDRFSAGPDGVRTVNRSVGRYPRRVEPSVHNEHENTP